MHEKEHQANNETPALTEGKREEIHAPFLKGDDNV
jgi:hypothetical protein